ncbi:hypothetical protein [Halocella sp. SP3-1]|uniref:hypothetical protein n=1 Tax=Halocella sp. SP3-1 TaxID=2382161 RepID=UPI000F75EB6F|nr:hypothetical protein [Halocella sp. SP3-1]AZO95071.1 hypothetical protein D7D81_10980 [Halocella sp. SP3-1]
MNMKERNLMIKNSHLIFSLLLLLSTIWMLEVSQGSLVSYISLKGHNGMAYFIKSRSYPFFIFLLLSLFSIVKRKVKLTDKLLYIIGSLISLVYLIPVFYRGIYWGKLVFDKEFSLKLATVSVVIIGTIIFLIIFKELKQCEKLIFWGALIVMAGLGMEEFELPVVLKSLSKFFGVSPRYYVEKYYIFAIAILFPLVVIMRDSKANFISKLYLLLSGLAIGGLSFYFFSFWHGRLLLGLFGLASFALLALIPVIVDLKKRKGLISNGISLNIISSIIALFIYTNYKYLHYHNKFVNILAVIEFMILIVAFISFYLWLIYRLPQKINSKKLILSNVYFLIELLILKEYLNINFKYSFLIIFILIIANIILVLHKGYFKIKDIKFKVDPKGYLFLIMFLALSIIGTRFYLSFKLYDEIHDTRNEELMIKYLNFGAKANKYLLDKAIEYNEFDLAERLIDKGIKPDTNSLENLIGYMYYDRKAAIKFIVEQGIKPTERLINNLLLIKVDNDLVNYLIKAESQISYKSLLIAANNYPVELTDKLYQAVNMKEYEKAKIDHLSYLIMVKKRDLIAKLLKEEIDIRERDSEGYYPMGRLMKKADKELLDFLIKQGLALKGDLEYKDELLYSAITTLNFEFVKYLIEEHGLGSEESNVLFKILYFDDFNIIDVKDIINFLIDNRIGFAYEDNEYYTNPVTMVALLDLSEGVKLNFLKKLSRKGIRIKREEKEFLLQRCQKEGKGDLIKIIKGIKDI